MDREHAVEHEPTIHREGSVFTSTPLFRFVKRTQKVEVNTLACAHLQVPDFIDHIERSCDRALRKQSTDLEKFISPLKGKLKSFTASLRTTFDQYVESCNNSQSEHDQQLVRTVNLY
ncbi:hypothetical protein MRB53_020130 [Persea americana]|uniref:Uncharacterized protein n=1 Tax=Persea americana TaxID=3435 RepID=A0ACC2L0E2_PERAE|nr:hypothetical protein MRB53_020130 [Persea americana]